MADMAEATPGRAALDELRFELKRGDAYEQHLASRIEDALDVQTEAWLAWKAAREPGRVVGYKIGEAVYDPADVVIIRET